MYRHACVGNRGSISYLYLKPLDFPRCDGVLLSEVCFHDDSAHVDGHDHEQGIVLCIQ